MDKITIKPDMELLKNFILQAAPDTDPELIQKHIEEYLLSLLKPYETENGLPTEITVDLPSGIFDLKK